MNKNKGNISKFCLGCMLMLLSITSYSTEPETPCLDWSYSDTFDWLSCNSIEWEDDAKKAMIDSAKENIQAAALDYIIANTPVGIIFGLVQNPGPSALDIAVEKILDSIKESEENLKEHVNQIFSIRDNASLANLKEQILLFETNNEQIQQTDHFRLLDFSQKAGELANHFTIYSDPSISGRIDAIVYHNYIASRALQMTKYTEWLVRKYLEQNIDDSEFKSELNDALRIIVQSSLSWIDLIDWRRDAESVYTNYNFTKQTNLGHFNDKYISKVTFKYKGNTNTIDASCIPPHPMRARTIECVLKITGNAITKVFNILPGTQGTVPIKDFHAGIINEWDPELIYERFIDTVEKQLITDAYTPTQEILDSWYTTIDPDGTRPPNYADLKTQEYIQNSNIPNNDMGILAAKYQTPYGNWNNDTRRTRILDINGDDQDDILIGPKSDGSWYLIKSEGTEMVDKGAISFNGFGSWTGSGSTIRINTMDVNGDNKDDLVIGPQKSGEWHVFLSNGDTFVRNNSNIWADAYGGWYDNSDRVWPMDVNGDGKQDVVIGPQSNGNWYYLESTGTRFINRGKILDKYNGWYDHSNRIRVMDIDGDNDDDIVIGPKSNGNWYLIESYNNSFIDRGIIANMYSSWNDHESRIHVSDLNGDNKDDILIGPRSTGEWYGLISNGTHLIDKGILVKAHGGWHNNTDRIRILDIDGDNKDDVLIGPESKGNWYALKSKGNHLEKQTYVPTSYGAYYNNPKNILILDQNGDGKEDIIIGPNSNGEWGHIKGK